MPKGRLDIVHKILDFPLDMSAGLSIESQANMEVGRMPKKAVQETLQALQDVELVRQEVRSKQETDDLKAKYADINEKYKHTITLLRESDERLDSIMGLRESIGDVEPRHITVPPPRKPGSAVPVLVASDWHLEERVDPKTVDGVNEFNLQIAEARITKFFQRGLELVGMLRTRSNIDTLVLAVLGDLITNMIHEDQAESNYLSPTEATLTAYRWLCGGIDLLLKEGGFKRLLIPCCFGNHGRVTKKMRVSTAAKTSYEWMMYRLAAERYANDKRIEFQIADGYFTFVKIYDYVIRCHHGNGIQYQGGVGGVSIPLNKAIAQWNKMRHADLDILGHWHARQMSSNFVVNGALIGFSPYSIIIKGSYERPQQSLFLMHPRWGKTVEMPVFVD